MKIALVYDRVNKWGGAERVLESFHKLWPKAPLYTSLYDASSAPWAKIFTVLPSFMQHIPFAKNHHEFFPWLTPIAFEQFDFSAFDVVISITSAEAKSIITKPSTLHICYCLTPPRYLWTNEYQKSSGIGFGLLDIIVKRYFDRLAPLLRMWDQLSSSRPDKVVTISHAVAKRIKKVYRRNAQVIYPPVDTEFFSPGKYKKGDYFLCVGRLVTYKRFDVIIEACNTLQVNLVVIGIGNQLEHLKRIAGPTITFKKDVDEDTLRTHYREAKAVICAGNEDFGLTAVEAQACGTPVLVYKEGGFTETVIEGKTGLFFEEQTASSLITSLKKFDEGVFKSADCREQANHFGYSRFSKEFYTMVEKYSNKLQV